MRIIERPDSTTIVLEREYHLLRNADEVQNIINTVDIESISDVIVINLVNKGTFEPMKFFTVKTRVPFFGETSVYYACKYTDAKELFDDDESS